MWLGPLILVALGIAAVVWVVRFSAGSDRAQTNGNHTRRRGLDALEERYARGEISREDFLQKKNDLGG
jgi:putative membrane protein